MWSTFIVALPIMVAAFALVWAMQRGGLVPFAKHVVGDAGIVDVAWGAGLGLSAVIYALIGDGSLLRRALLALFIGYWAWRYASYVYRDRIVPEEEDQRYAAYRVKKGAGFQRWLFLFYQFQGVTVWALAVVYLVIASNPASSLSALEWIGFVLLASAIALERVADRQLETWRRNPANKGKTCRGGLWAYTRHPNYFCQWMIWVSLALIALSAPYGWVGLLPAAAMFGFIVFMTGIPPNEAQNLRRRGEDYRRYQQEVSMFFPWFPKVKQ